VKYRGLAIIVVGALVVGAGVFAVTRTLFAPAEDEAIEMVPSDAVLYANFFVRPSNGQKRAIESLLEAGGLTPEEAEDDLQSLFDKGLSEIDATFEDDIDPWLGNQAALFLTSFEEEDPDGAAVIAVTSRGEAEDFIDKVREETGAGETEERSYEGVEYMYQESDETAFGFVGDFLVAGTEDGFKAVVDTSESGDSLAGTDGFDDVTGRIQDDYLGLIYVDFGAAIESARAAGDLSAEDEEAIELFGEAFDKPFAAAGYASEDGLVLESATPVPTEGAAGAIFDTLDGELLLEELPEESWTAFGLPDVGGLTGAIYDLLREQGGEAFAEAEQGIAEFEEESGLDFEDDIIGGLQGTRLFVTGNIGPATRGGLIVDTSDQNKASEIVTALRAAIEEEGGAGVEELDLEGYDEGFMIGDPGTPDIGYVVVDGARIVAGFGEEATLDALEGDESLEESESFRRAGDLLGDDYEPYYYLDLDVVIGAFQTFSTAEEPKEIEPILEAAQSLAVGVKNDDDYLLSRLVIGANSDDEI
jgi:Protein of unknown function (DUF3352)